MQIRVEAPNLLVMRITGILRLAEFDQGRCIAVNLIRETGTASVLVLLDGFQGWEGGVNWGDVSFLAEHEGEIEKIAVVGQEKWRDEVLAFTAAGLRRSPVRYFNDLASARAWLGEPISPGAPQLSKQ